MLPVIFSKSLTAAASANNVCASQTIGAGGGTLNLNGAAVVNGVAVLDSQRRIIITSGSNDSAVTFTVYGTNDAGIAISSAVQGANVGVAVLPVDFRTITRITASTATGAVTVGTNSTGSSQWFMPNYHLAPFILDIECGITGSVTYSIETTMDDYWTPPGQNLVGMPAYTGIVLVRPTTVVAATAGSSLVITAPCRGWRATITAGSGSVTCEALQAGISNV
jgi:hypothetical protein